MSDAMHWWFELRQEVYVNCLGGGSVIQGTVLEIPWSKLRVHDSPEGYLAGVPWTILGTLRTRED